MSKRAVIDWARSVPEWDGNTVAALLRSYATMIEKDMEPGMAAFYVFAESLTASYRALRVVGDIDLPPLE